MKRKSNVFVLFVTVFLFLFTAFMIWYLPSSASIQSKIDDARQNLETSRGRENKQLDEYQKAVSALPAVKEELSVKQPQADEAEQLVTSLKERRKELRAQLKNLQDSVNSFSGNETQNSGEEDHDHE